MIDITEEYLASQHLSPNFPERFWSKVFVLTYDKGCWIWMGSRATAGYGNIWRGAPFGGIPISCHVASWIMHFGPVPQGADVCHTCDTPSCVRPEHLFLGDATINSEDMFRKGRGRPGWVPGEKCGTSKLTESHVRTILGSEETGVSLALEFGVTPAAISLIRRRVNWKHVQHGIKLS